MGTMRRRPDELSHLDADALTRAHRRPELTIGRLLYRGRLLSIEEWLPWWERLQTIDAKPAGRERTEDEAHVWLLTRMAFFRAYLMVVFPRRDFRFWAPDPVAHLMRQPLQVVEQAMAFFFILQAEATFGAEELGRNTASASRTGGIGSPSKTADAAPAGVT